MFNIISAIVILSSRLLCARPQGKAKNTQKSLSKSARADSLWLPEAAQPIQQLELHHFWLHSVTLYHVLFD